MKASMKTLGRFVPHALLILPVVAGFSMAAVWARNASAEEALGRRVFLTNCALCHGKEARGDGPLASELAKAAGVHPRNLTDAKYMRGRSLDEIRQAVLKGGAHVGRSNLMPPWGEKLDAESIDAVVTYVRGLTSPSREEEEAEARSLLAGPSGKPDRGRELYVMYCLLCHGKNGRGDGPNAENLIRDFGVHPQNFTDPSLKTLSDEFLFTVITKGGGHVGKSDKMPAWGLTIPPDQVKDLIAYLRTFSPRSPGGPPQP